MSWYQKLLAQLFGPSIVGQLIRGLMKVVAGFLIGLGLPEALVGKFSDNATELLIALIMILVSQVGSAKATKKALDTPPETPKLVKE